MINLNSVKIGSEIILDNEFKLKVISISEKHTFGLFNAKTVECTCNIPMSDGRTMLKDFVKFIAHPDGSFICLDENYKMVEKCFSCKKEVNKNDTIEFIEDIDDTLCYFYACTSCCPKDNKEKNFEMFEKLQSILYP